MADDDLTDDERELLRKHRAKSKPARKVRVYGKQDDAEYEFELEGDEAEGVIKRHSKLWESKEPAEGDPQPGQEEGKSGTVRFGRRVS